MDVGGWLRKLGLEQYEAVFRENRIDDTVLPSLTAEDLKDLGVGFVGDVSAGVRGALGRTDIIERTDGIPMFVEKMTKAVPDGVPRFAHADLRLVYRRLRHAGAQRCKGVARRVGDMIQSSALATSEFGRSRHIALPRGFGRKRITADIEESPQSTEMARLTPQPTSGGSRKDHRWFRSSKLPRS